MSAAEHINEAVSILKRSGHSDVDASERGEADSYSTVAIAAALADLAQTVKADPLIPAGPLPEGVTARIVTAYGLRFNDLRATVDVIDEYTVESGHVSRAICGPCSRQVADSPQVYRSNALDKAAEHARSCMAMPQPAGEEDER